ncbi:small basic protein [Clostridium thermosuccinogenes]|jgi:small basic protein|uniref:Small basic protein n=1 Tax=Clostridium thermosuccinogenes TaxID=84032 RepID=A0A2K2FMK8_9CLOT|nr:small basic family protein [Pseudoclostridium thermosuccinogenes]AUS96569.1 small basic protein [Pseudoclostridium thermosuccinogenes]PNT92771.1 small basic protein [Pseudoclostridium thermosuccinogenes]PNT98005.1 small basic protein [Pseudoclostridium thermosuccinogenes]PNU00025.1 small basic protein [Pseudoclostridium thermosuccinogenes]
MIPILGLIIGIIAGVFVPYNIPSQYSNYVAVAILAALDSVFGGIASSLQGKFNMRIFLTGFFGNAILASMLAYIGDQLGIQLYLAAIFAFGNRLFLNFALIRRIILNIPSKNDNIKDDELHDI